MSRRNGFTLIELMVVVSIVSILAASAIPFLYRAVMRTRSAEAPVITAAVRSNQIAYFGRNDLFVECAPAPDDTPGPVRRAWADPSGDFKSIGFTPEGTFFFSYRVHINGVGNAFNVGARSDLDGDGHYQNWGFMWTAPDGAVAPFPWGVPMTKERESVRLSGAEFY
jgi:prepilin-type N-terminal cleavage/methylation domain-containing protein